MYNKINPRLSLLFAINLYASCSNVKAKQNFSVQGETFFLLPKVKSEPRLRCQDSAHKTKRYYGCYLSALLLTDTVFTFSSFQQVYLYLNCQWKLAISRLVLN